MSDLAELWAERQKRKAKHYSRYAKPIKYLTEINSKSDKRLSKNCPLISSIYDLTSPEMREKLKRIF